MTCMLISTFDRFEKLACWILERIDREWAHGILEMRWPGVIRQMLV